MGIFTRMRDIVNANISAMLDRAEDPEKLIKLMIQEMEDTLVEIKASCAGTIATQKRVDNEGDQTQRLVNLWNERAELAMGKGREDLAREALREKNRNLEKAESLDKECSDCQALVSQYKSDIAQLEDKLNSARDKHRMLVRRHIHAQRKKKAEQGIRKVETSDAWVRFEQFENRIDRMEAEADLVNSQRRGSLEEAFDELDSDDDVEAELEALRQRVSDGKKSKSKNASGAQDASE